MSARAKRLVQPSAISQFEWSTVSPSASPQAPRSTVLRPEAPAPPPVAAEPDPAEIQARLAALERDAFAKGFAQGERAGAEAARERGEAMLRRLTQTIDELMALRTQMIHQTERQMVQLALAVARRVVHREVSLDQDLLVAMARVALERLGESARVTVRFHPEEFEAISARRANDWAGASVSVVADPRVGRGGCRVESEFGTLDAGVDAQLQELARALLGDGAGVTHGE
jgi:flagellar assembly protein FliH